MQVELEALRTKVCEISSAKAFRKRITLRL